MSWTLLGTSMVPDDRLMSFKHPQPMLGSPTPTEAERGCVIDDATAAHPPFMLVRQVVAGRRCERHETTTMRDRRDLMFGFKTIALRCLLAIAIRLPRWLHATSMRPRPPRRPWRSTSLRPPGRCEHGAVLPCRKGRQVRRRASQRLLQQRGRIAGGARARRQGRQRTRARRHQRADPLSRQGRCGAGQGGVRAVQPRALRDRRPQEPRRPPAAPTSTARPSASPTAICRSGCGRRWRGRTASSVAQ